MPRYLLLQLWSLFSCSHATLPQRRFATRQQADAPSDRPSVVNCTWTMFDQKIDHFGNTPGTFKQRICIYDKYHGDAKVAGFDVPASTPGPIFAYIGNEANVEEYINNTGLMWELGKKMNAKLVFMEHRFEPLSHPDLAGANAPERCFAFLTTAQAIADYAEVIKHLNPDRRLPVVGFGGSYGGMLAGWMRMRYPDVIDGAIAASAPIWQLASTVRHDTLDLGGVAISRGLSKAGGASDRCWKNLQVAWPLLEEVGKSSSGMELISKSVNSCNPLLSARNFTSWAHGQYFNMAEGNYPFPSTYITYNVGPGLYPLPAWPMRVACSYLDKDFGFEISGSPEDVKYTMALGKIKVNVDWQVAKGNGASLTAEDIKASGVLDLAKAVAEAAGVWYNVTKDQTCWNIPTENEPEADTDSFQSAKESTSDVFSASKTQNTECPACPPCADCPPCPVSKCEQTGNQKCSFKGKIPITIGWEGICATEDMSQIMVTGLGRDIYWPPGVESRNYTVESVVGPHGFKPGPNKYEDWRGLKGAPIVSDPWSGWLTAYYGGRNVSHHTNIVWSNGLLDPWSGTGVYPPGGGPDPALPMRQNISADGSQFALLIALGGHHLDLMFSDHRDPPCAKEARRIETESIRKWSQDAYDRNGLQTMTII